MSSLIISIVLFNSGHFSSNPARRCNDVDSMNLYFLLLSLILTHNQLKGEEKGREREEKKRTRGILLMILNRVLHHLLDHLGM